MDVAVPSGDATFGDLLRRHRLAAGLTQEELAERAGLSKRGISDLERGARTRPQRETVRLLADALGLAGPKRAVFIAAARRSAAVGRAGSATTATTPYPEARLPVPLDSLIGRERELAELAALFRGGEFRLLTLTGTGGVGKTRLALAVAEQVAPAFADGVVFVPLAPLSDPAMVASAVAERLGARERAERSLRDVLVTRLARKRLLLFLDNFEHVLPAAPLVADLLGACPGLTVLTTSRAALHLSGERIYPVSTLALPDADRLPSLQELGRTAAVRLFVDRVRAVKPAFALSESIAPAVVAIVRRLDGLPLALELVAARAQILSPAALLTRLDRSLPLLTGGPQDLPARQRSLRDTVAWSYDLLHPHEQALFRRLGVFAAGCTLEAAEAVATLKESFDVLEGMGSLVRSSLVQSEERDAESRFTMLATIREFALDRLIERGEERATRDRHARFFRDLAESTHPRMFETADAALLGLLEREHDNLRTALAWSRDTGDHDTFLRLAAALAFFWYYRGYLNEGRRWLGQALQTPAQDSAPWPRAWALTMSGMLASGCGESERATELLAESFRWWKQTDDVYGHAIAGNILGGVHVSQGQYGEAADLFAANSDYFRSAGHVNLLGHTIFHLGAIAWAQGADARARALMLEAVDCYERSGAPGDAIDPLRYLGLIACAAGDHRQAAEWFEDELTRLRQRGSRAALAVGLADVATLAAAREAWEPAARLFAKAEAMMRTEAAAFSLPARDHYEHGHSQVRDTLGEVAYAAAAVAGRALTLEQALAEAVAVLNGAALVACGQGRAAPSDEVIAEIESGLTVPAMQGTVAEAIAVGPARPAAALVAEGRDTTSPIAADPAVAIGLTRREREVLGLLADGRSDKEIADALYISPKTVELQVSHLLGKLGVSSRAAAVAYVHRHLLAKDRPIPPSA